MTIDTTVKRIPSPGFLEILAGGGIAAVVIFSVGVFLMVVPVLGWLLGPALMITAGLVAGVHVVGIMRNKTEFAGHCPYCGAAATAGGPESIGTCGECANRFIHRRGELRKIA